MRSSSKSIFVFAFVWIEWYYELQPDESKKTRLFARCKEESAGIVDGVGVVEWCCLRRRRFRFVCWRFAFCTSCHFSFFIFGVSRQNMDTKSEWI